MDAFGILQIVVTVATVLIGGLTVLLSVSFLGGRALRPSRVRTRLLTGILAALVVIALAGLDIYLAVSAA
jgi:hypothetical protein